MLLHPDADLPSPPLRLPQLLDLAPELEAFNGTIFAPDDQAFLEALAMVKIADITKITDSQKGLLKEVLVSEWWSRRVWVGPGVCVGSGRAGQVSAHEGAWSERRAAGPDRDWGDPPPSPRHQRHVR